jgi:hypothetical protein
VVATLSLKNILFLFIVNISCLGFYLPVAAANLDCQAYYQDKIASKPNRLSTKSQAQVEKYLLATLNSHESMRGPNHLVKDTLWIKKISNGKVVTKTLNANTSPTNIAIDLLIQTELLSRQSHATIANKNLTKLLATLGQLERHNPSGLFFSWYSTNKKSTPVNRNISSIDNLHLAMALWTIKESFPKAAFADQARVLFEAMNLSMFYEERSGLIGGNYSYSHGKWSKDAYNFSNLGSEARILYSAGWALGLFKNFRFESDFVEKAFNSLQSEVLHSQQGPLLKLWDGSAFQLFFPKMFVSEESFSPVLKKMYSNYGNYMIAEGQRRQLPVPAAHSPGVNRIHANEYQKPFAVYNDKAGNKELVSSANKDLHDPEYFKNWDQTFTPYALFMAATTNPEKFLPLIENIKNINFNNGSLYLSEVGWLDGLNLSPELVNKVVPAQLAVNQGMIALALLQMQSTDGKSASGRALYKDQKVKERMKLFYEILDAKLSQRGH